MILPLFTFTFTFTPPLEYLEIVLPILGSRTIKLLIHSQFLHGGRIALRTAYAFQSHFSHFPSATHSPSHSMHLRLFNVPLAFDPFKSQRPFVAVPLGHLWMNPAPQRRVVPFALFTPLIFILSPPPSLL